MTVPFHIAFIVKVLNSRNEVEVDDRRWVKEICKRINRSLSSGWIGRANPTTDFNTGPLRIQERLPEHESDILGRFYSSTERLQQFLCS